MEWQIIQSGRVWSEAGGPFGLVPRALWSRHIEADDHNRVPMDLNCLLIQSDDQVILIDTGLGDKLTGKERTNWGYETPHGTLLENLANQGIEPNDVDIVIDTHLHWDHCGGNTYIKDGIVVPRFPRAKYFVQYIEWADAALPNERTRATYLAENFIPVWENDQLRLLKGNTDITSEVQCVVTPGHTRGHQCVVLKGGDNPVLYIADLATFAIHFARSAWVTAFDVEPLETITTKKRWQDWSLKNNATIIFEHDTQVPLGKLIENEKGKLEVQPTK